MVFALFFYTIFVKCLIQQGRLLLKFINVTIFFNILQSTFLYNCCYYYFFKTCPQTCPRINWIVSCQSGFFFGLFAPNAFNCHLARPKMDVVRDGPLENIWRGGGRSIKKIFAQGKITRKKIHALTPINPKIHSCYGLKKIHTKHLITKKNSCSSKIPLPPSPNNFSNGPSFMGLQQGAHQRLNSKEHNEN